jgi:hypothetical protein
MEPFIETAVRTSNPTYIEIDRESNHIPGEERAGPLL